MSILIERSGPSIVLKHFEAAAFAVEQFVGTLVDQMTLQLVERLVGVRGALEGAPSHHEAAALLHVRKTILQGENLVAVATVDPDLVNDVVQIPVLLLVHKRLLALAAPGAALGKPLLNAAAMENLFASTALN